MRFHLYIEKGREVVMRHILLTINLVGFVFAILNQIAGNANGWTVAAILFICTALTMVKDNYS